MERNRLPAMENPGQGNDTRQRRNSLTVTEIESGIYHLRLEVAPTEEDRDEEMVESFLEFWIRDKSTNRALSRAIDYLDSHSLTLVAVLSGPSPNNRTDPPNNLDYAKGYWVTAQKDGFAVLAYGRRKDEA